MTSVSAGHIEKQIVKVGENKQGEIERGGESVCVRVCVCVCVRERERERERDRETQRNR